MMFRRAMCAAALFCSVPLLPLTASALDVSIDLGWQEPPPAVEVSPGVQVVQDQGDEVFVSGGHYWVERNNRWYWANDHHGHWTEAPAAQVPRFLHEHHRGQYVHYKHAEPREMKHEEKREDRAVERREEKREERRDEHR